MKEEDNETYKTTREILALAQEMHRKLSDFYHEHKAHFEDERVAMLMRYMERHEKQMQDTLSETISSVSEKVLATYYQYEPSEIDVLLELVANWHIEPNAGVDDVVDRVIRFDEIMRNFYSRAADMAPSEEVVDVFTNLKSGEEEKRNAKVRDATLLKDL